MSVSCEISNVLSNYANTIYMMDQVPYEADLLPLPNMDLPFEMTDRSSWSSEFPFWWTKQHVLEWISYHVEKNKWDASAIDFSCCNMDGAWLCRLSCEDLLAMFGPLGEKLHNHLCELNSYFIPDLNELLSDLPFYDDQPVNQQHDSSQCSSSDGELQDNKPSMTELTFPFENRFQLGSPSSEDCSSSNAPNSPGSTGFGGSESDLERACSKSNLLMDVLQDFESDLNQQKRKRGRPRKISKDNRDCLESKKNKHSSRGSHLWEFIRDILIHPELNEGLMKWEDRSEGIFKFLRSEAVAQLWGQKKKNTSMTYEKLSRAMRYYYKREILERVDGRRLVYKFGKNSSGWKEEEALSNQS